MVPSKWLCRILGCLAVASLIVAPAQTTATPAFDGQRALEHVVALTNIGKRPAASAMGRRAADYLKAQFEAYGYLVTEHSFPMLAFEEKETKLSIVGSDAPGIPASALLYSPSGHLEGEVVAVPRPGMPADFARVDLKGKIALVQRGGIWLREKTACAAKAGAIAVLIYNSAPQAYLGTLRDPALIPTIALSGKEGERLREAREKGTIILRLDSDTILEQRNGVNIVATKPGTGKESLVFGAHYDTVTNSPGANDNASGVAVTLELARVLARTPRPETLVFLGFDGEEEGLLGSSAYVKQLTSKQQGAIKAMFNFDELGAGDSPYKFDGNKALVKKAIKTAKQLGKEALREDSGSGSDHASFAEVGVPVLFVYREDAGFHTPQDTPDRVQAEWLGVAGNLALDLLKD